MTLSVVTKEFVADSDEPPQVAIDSVWNAEPNRPMHARRLREQLYADRRVSTFRRKFYPEVSTEDWNDWQWQLSHRIHTLDGIKRFLDPTDDELRALVQHEKQLPFSVTPYYLSTIALQNPLDAIRKTVIPSCQESIISFGESVDPLSEHHDSPVPGIVHRYPDRVLFLVTNFCAMYCRYCTRSRLVGGHAGTMRSNWESAITYIRQHTQIRDVLISGGDPLTLRLPDLTWLLDQITAIPHVEIVRIGTKVPVVMPMRVNTELVHALKKYRPLYMSIHFTHPNEITPAVAKACERLADNGIIMGSQTVLLKGVNDSVETLKKLYHYLLAIRVRPYYLYQCDPIAGSAHFRTTIEKGKEMIQGLRGYTSGYAVPQYIIDSPGGGGKIPVLPDYDAGRDDSYVYLRNYEGKLFSYPDPLLVNTADREEVFVDNYAETSIAAKLQEISVQKDSL